MCIRDRFIIVEPFFLIITVIPDETSLITVLCNRGISQQIPVFMYGIHVKQENAFRIQIIIYQFKHMTQFISVRNICLLYTSKKLSYLHDALICGIPDQLHPRCIVKIFQ